MNVADNPSHQPSCPAPWKTNDHISPCFPAHSYQQTLLVVDVFGWYWLTVKPKLDVVVAGGSCEPIRWGDWGLAVELQLRYPHPRDGSLVEIEQAVRVRRDEPFKLHVGQHAEIVAWGVMPVGCSGIPFPPLDRLILQE